MAFSVSNFSNFANDLDHPGSSNNRRDAPGGSLPNSYSSLDDPSDVAPPDSGTEKGKSEISANEPLVTSSQDQRPWTPTTVTSSEVATDEMEDARSHFDGDSDTGIDHQIGKATSRMDRIFRLLDLVDERGSGGLVEKVIIDQADLHRLLNTILPGSYSSVTKINFKALDQLNIKPKGLYGVKSEIAKFLHRTGCIDEQFATSFDLPENLELDSTSELRPGLYLALPPETDATASTTYETYIFFWPEDESWVDNAPSAVHRNRVTFMRYLTKLCDQVVALVSPSQVESFVWDARLQNAAAPSELTGDRSGGSRVYSFEVLTSLEQEESVVASPGFTVNPKLKLPAKGPSLSMKLALAEQNSGLIVSTDEGADFTSKSQEQPVSEMSLRKMIERNHPTLSLGNLDIESLMILGDLGLRKRYPSAFAGYDKWVHDQGVADQRLRGEIEQAIEADASNVRRGVEYIIFNLFHQVYPSANVRVNSPELYLATEATLQKRYPDLSSFSDYRFHTVATAIEDTTFQGLKLKWQLIYDALTMKQGRSDKDIKEFIDNVLNSGSHSRTQKKKKGIYFSMPDFVKSINLPFVPDFLKGALHAGFTSLFHGGTRTSLPDQEFIHHLRTLSNGSPALSNLADQIIESLCVYLKSLGNDILRRHVPSVLAAAKERESRAGLHKRHSALRSERERLDLELLKNLRSAMVLDESNHIQIDALSRNPNATWAGGVQYYQMRSQHNMHHAPQTRFDVYPLVLTEADAQQCRIEKTHLPRPRITPQHKFSFTLETGRSLEFLEILGDKCLVIVKERTKSRLYIDDSHGINAAINNTGGKLTLRDDRLRGKCLYAFDQRTRLLAMFYGGHEEPKVSVYYVDEGLKEVKARGPALSLKQWYENQLEVQSICFVSGFEELCLVESSGRARILSLITEQFLPGSVQPNGQVIDAFTSPDGSCLFLTVVDEGAPTHEEKLLAFHWASFGTNPGIEVATLPPSKSNRVITSFEDRSRAHILSLLDNGAISSLGLQIKHKSMEFSLQSDRDIARAADVDTLSNCLADCHLEVWTRFPVLPAVARTVLSPADRQARSITFVSTVGMPRMEAYFSRMISFLGSTACKPVGNVLSSTLVGSSTQAPEAIVPGLLASSFPLGSFVTELLCLIPIHLAITRENQFVPLKDGVWNPEHEQSLLGAEVTTIIDSLSIGWYESIFQSYHATKPVRVVSSMGEQSVGKSYCLNHFADTSFAGSAMRTTEGVWLSCTPTNEYLLVTLDFEAVHSLERSPQEDALLVLFNTAISNLVLFRNNFALSRDISGLFTSFQSSTMLLDPDENRDLFNSTLAIIIKDVTDSDTNDIVKEFQLKFRQIIAEERDQNFISKLHRGRIQIIPWPVINSHGFYSIFNDLSRRLNEQTVTHPSGGVFLHRLKTLMAKIKASDWGSLDQNLAAHRAQQLRGRLPLALRLGRTEQGLEATGPLKNLDTDEDLLSNDIGIEFFVPSLTNDGAEESESAIGQTLTALIRLYQPTASARQSIPDTQYIAEIQQQLSGQLDERLKYVRTWVHANVSRFPAENQDIRDVLRTLDTVSFAMHSQIQICSAVCSACNLRCLRPHRHSGDHECGTNHQCIFPCDVAQDHNDQPVPCGLRAGHDSTHMCDVGVHLCGNSCGLSSMRGCAKSCVKPLKHEGSHLCSARSHLCGQPCDLRDIRGMEYHCPGYCNIAWDEPHDRHACEQAISCPLKCQLCQRLCAHANHFHALEDDAVHLCGQEHACASLCAAGGKCQIETQPSAIQAQFTGRHEIFQYTRYSQVERRLPCRVPIPPGELQHQGVHIHSLEAPVFHYCDAQCPNCRYYCTLPIGHQQKFHETRHGSMTTTQWVREADNDLDACYEVAGHKYGSGDEGAPILCNLLCAAQGRHVHVDYCRAPDNCVDPECQHIPQAMRPDPERPKDWVSHNLHWARMAFKDPYSREEQLEFSKCTAMCADPEHEATVSAPARPSYCKLPIFHRPQRLRPGSTLNSGYISPDGHLFDCSDPVQLQRGYHVVFVVDNSGSMAWQDRRPLPDTPVSGRLRSSCNNRYGAALSALYGFWSTRESRSGVSSAQPRQDAYSVITFDTTAIVQISVDSTSTPKQLIDQLRVHSSGGGTSFDRALACAESLIESEWDIDKTPVVIFLSDGECHIEDKAIYSICRMCVRLGKALAFHSVSFGNDRHSVYLRQMAKIATEVYSTAPTETRGDPRGIPCSYADALNSVELSNTFLRIENSLQKPKASLIARRERFVG